MSDPRDRRIRRADIVGRIRGIVRGHAVAVMLEGPPRPDKAREILTGLREIADKCRRHGIGLDAETRRSLKNMERFYARAAGGDGA